MDARAATDVCGSSVRRSRVVLTSRCWRQVLRVTSWSDGGKRAVHRGELAISRKAIAQGRPECFRRTCMLVCVFAVCIGTRDRGCGAHPVFPAPSDKEEGKEDENLGRNAPRDREVTSIRHCERSEAIHCRLMHGKMDCFAALAMTVEAAIVPPNIPLSSSSAFAINSSLTTTVGRGTRKNIADAHAIESAKIAAVNGSVVVEWPPR